MKKIKFDPLPPDVKKLIGNSLKRGDKVSIRFDKKLGKWRWLLPLFEDVYYEFCKSVVVECEEK